MTKEKTNVCTYVCMYVCHVIRTKKKKSRILSYKERKTKRIEQKRKETKKKEIAHFKSSSFIKYTIQNNFSILSCIIIMHHVAGTAAKPHAVNPRKIARVTSPSPRLSGKKDFPKKQKKSRYRYKNKKKRTNEPSKSPPSNPNSRPSSLSSIAVNDEDSSSSSSSSSSPPTTG